MARVQEFYKGRRKRRNYALIPFVVLLFMFSLGMVLFYGMQKYAVITDDGVSVELPILKDPSATTVDSSGREIRNFPKVQTEIIFDEPDYINVKAEQSPNAPPVRAIFVPAENISHDKLMEYEVHHPEKRKKKRKKSRRQRKKRLRRKKLPLKNLRLRKLRRKKKRKKLLKKRRRRLLKRRKKNLLKK